MYVLLEFWQKNHGDLYYESTIVVHDITLESSDLRCESGIYL